VVASKAVVDHINATKEAKLAFWGPQMKEGAPTKLIVPQVTTATRFTVDGEPLELKHTGDYAAYVWIPANKAILGGTGIASGIHVWTADTQTPAIRKQWMTVLSEMQALKPRQVIPGHYWASARQAMGRLRLPMITSIPLNRHWHLKRGRRQ
jgi:glyoxylase-like metal-dependent hydrolase (beta-lactamase superfamily II)